MAVRELQVKNNCWAKWYYSSVKCTSSEMPMCPTLTLKLSSGSLSPSVLCAENNKRMRMEENEREKESHGVRGVCRQLNWAYCRRPFAVSRHTRNYYRLSLVCLLAGLPLVFSALLLPLILSLNELYPVLYIYRAGKYTHSVQQQ